MDMSRQVGLEPIGTMALAKQTPAQLEVDYWEEVIFGNDLGLSAGYLLDRSVPWSPNAFETVLRPPDACPEEGLSLSERSEIVTEIAKIFTSWLGGRLCETPLVHFKGQDVHVIAPFAKLSEALWSRPPVVRGQKMKMVSKGFPKKNVKVHEVFGLQAKERYKVMESLQSLEEGLVSVASANLYRVTGMSDGRHVEGDSVCDGDMLIFGSAALPGKKTFLGRRFLEIVYPQID